MEERVFQQLGPRTFFLLLMRRIGLGVFLLGVTLAANSVVGSVPALGSITLAGVGMSVFVLLTSIFIGWFDYIRYRIELGKDSIAITRGILHQTEVVVPFRRVQNVVIERGIVDQIIGTSDVSFSIAHAEGEDPTRASQKPIVLPALEHTFAERLQQELMKRANTEEIAVKAHLTPLDG